MTVQRNSTVKDLTHGSPMKLVVGFALPLVLGILFQQFYSVVDTAIVGRFLGANALAAVGSTGSLNFLIIGLSNGMCSGFAIPIAQSFGAKEEGELRRYLMNAIYLCAVTSVLLSLITGTLCPVFLRWMSTPEEILDQAVSYIRLIFYSIPTIMMYNMAGGIMRSLGDSKTPVKFLILASGLNIGLDLLFVLVIKLGVAGASLATVISQFVSGLGCVVVLIRRFPILRASQDERKFRPRYAGRLLSIGVPMGLQFSITAIGSVILQASVNCLGTVYVASQTAAGKVSMFFNCMFDALATTMATYAGQNVGARKVDRIHQGLKAAAIIGSLYSVIAFAALWFLGPYLLQIFVDGSESEVLKYGYQYLVINAAFYIPLLFVNIVRLTIQGMGFTTYAVMAGVMEMIARTLVGSLMVPRMGFIAACYASPLAWIMADLFLVPCYLKLSARLKKRFAQGSEEQPGEVEEI